MKKLLTVLLLLFNLTGALDAQVINVNPDPNGEPWLLGGLRELTQKDWDYLNSLPELKTSDYKINAKVVLPDVLDNSQNIYFRPIFNQADGSCAQASGIGYNFTYEINRTRNLAANTDANLYPTHYTYNFLNDGSGNNGSWYWDGWQIGMDNGIPNAVTYGGDINPLGDTGWMDGYENYLSGMGNRVLDVFTINVSNEEGLLTLKQWMYDHLDGSLTGGVVNFAAGISTGGYKTDVLPDSTVDAGKMVITKWGRSVNHAMTFVGYNDSVRYDFNGDGAYTNDLDITGDGVVDMRDWEIGAVIMVNSWGTGWGDGGKAYVPYCLLAKEVEDGGIWMNTVHAIKTKETYAPSYAMQVSITHTSRNKLKIFAGIANDTTASAPEYILEYGLFNYQGGDLYMLGGTTEDDKTIEFGLDLSVLLQYIEDDNNVKFFLGVTEDDVSGTEDGTINYYSVWDYTDGEVEEVCTNTPVAIANNATTYLSITKSVSFSVPQITTIYLPPATPGVDYSEQLEAVDGTEPYYWDINFEFAEEETAETFPSIYRNQLIPDNEDDGLAVLDLNFNFPFFGNSYDRIYVSTDGSILFNDGFVYLRDEEALGANVAIAVYAADLMMYEADGDGMWYESSDTSVAVRWKTSMYNQQDVNVEMAVVLHDNGDIEMFYGTDITIGSEWVSGVSDAASNVQLTSVSGMEDLPDNYSLYLTAVDVPMGMAISTDGVFSGKITESNRTWNIPFRVTDNLGLSSTTVLEFSVGATGITEGNTIEKFAMQQNYPNPFNPSTNISFTLPYNENVTLTVYNIMGQKVRTLINSAMMAGQHNVTWDGRDETGNLMPSGIYFYELKAGNYKKNMKMMLLK